MEISLGCKYGLKNYLARLFLFQNWGHMINILF